MNIVMYAGMTYGLTAIISLVVIALIVVMNKFLGGNSQENKEDTN